MKVIAHRGSSQVAPENTYPAIQRALQDKADGIEIDVQLTKDQEVVVIHDEWLNRTTNGKGFVAQTTSAQIKKLDAGSWFHKKYKKTRVPFLKEVLQWIQPYPVELHIELKNNLFPYHGIEEKVVQLVTDYGLEDKVIVSSFRRDSLEVCKRISPKIRTGYLCWSTLAPLLERKELGSLKLHSIHPHISLINQGEIAYLKKWGLKVYPYVVERKYELQKCIKYKVEGIFTNSPKRVRQLLLEDSLE